MSKEELLEYWQDLTADQQEEALNFLKALKQKTVAEHISPLGQSLRSIRQRIVASGTPLLTWDDLAKEVATRRGGEAAREP
jgi:predicted RecB family endonuclease